MSEPEQESRQDDGTASPILSDGSNPPPENVPHAGHTIVHVPTLDYAGPCSKLPRPARQIPTFVWVSAVLLIFVSVAMALGSFLLLVVDALVSSTRGSGDPPAMENILDMARAQLWAVPVVLIAEIASLRRRSMLGAALVVAYLALSIAQCVYSDSVGMPMLPLADLADLVELGVIAGGLLAIAGQVVWLVRLVGS